MRSEEPPKGYPARSENALRFAIACAFSLLASAATYATPFSFDDIQYWIGTGSNRAALVIDWVENAEQPAALAWGYRWNGTASGRDMLMAIIADDPRLFAKIGVSQSSDPEAVYGFGYDANDDASFSISDGTTFNSQGFYLTTEPQDLATANDNDYYGEGWFAAFWHYGVAAANPYDGGSWSDIPVGMVGRTLTDGAWDSWTFSPTFNFSSFAENPIAAEPPFAQGDFNHDTLIDAADYAVWRSSFGSTTDPAADANHSSVVDAADYVLWRHAASAGNGASTLGPNQIPEPNTVSFVTVIVMLTMFRRSSRH